MLRRLMATDSTPTSPDAPDEPARRPSRIGRVVRGPVTGGRWVGRVLAKGVPGRFVAALAALVLIAILFTVASRDPEKVRGYAEITLFPRACLIDITKQVNAVGCAALGPSTYRVVFSRPLKGSTPIASRGSCCPGSIGASADSDSSVVLALGKKVKKPTRVSVLIP